MTTGRADRPLRVALAHDWLTGMRGGEAVLERICLRYPDAPLYTLFHVPGSVSPAIEDRPIHTSLLDRLPGAHRHYRRLLPLFPLAVESLDLRGYDLLVSTSHAAVKALRLRPGAQHLCYVHTPMRYVYEQFEDYFGRGRAGLPVQLAMRALRPLLRGWDRGTAHRPTVLVANSHHVRERIRRHWHREADVIHPPVDLARLSPAEEEVPRQHYLVFGALAPYKRVDLAIEAFNRLGLPLVVAGGGPGIERYRRLAGPTVQVRGRVDDAEALALYRGAHALVFPGEEDFGITPLEAQACGTPVIALGRGGALETVRDLDDPRPTGLFFSPQSVDGLVSAVRRFEAVADRFHREDLLAQARAFSVERFDRELGTLLDEVESAARRGRVRER